MNTSKLFLAAGCIAGLTVGSLMMYVAWEHNPQGEFHDETGIHWSNWLTVGFTWFTLFGSIPLVSSVLTYFTNRK